MKNTFIVFILLSLICSAYAQDHTISFQPKENENPIDSIQATNLRTNEVVKLYSGESLVLGKTPTSSNPILNDLGKGIVYPNPTEANAFFRFSTYKGEDVELLLYDSSGQLLTQNKQYLDQGTHRFEVKFPAAGIYFLYMNNNGGTSSIKMICTDKKIYTSSISYSGSEMLKSQNINFNRLKHATADKTIAYSRGDVLQYAVFSGLNTTIISDIPLASKTIYVEFVSCIDQDNKSYKVVKIDNQWWMAENLAYLPTVSSPPNVSYTEPMYYVYDYLGTKVSEAKALENYNIYGVLYNWLAAKSACPPGWHLPSEAEWEQLEMTLGMTHDQILIPPFNNRGTDQGTQMKATNGWEGWDDGEGTNTSGFSVLPAGNCGKVFHGLGTTSSFWSSTEYSLEYHLSRTLYSSWKGVHKSYESRMYGISVRCIKDDEIIKKAPVSDFSALGTSITKGQTVQFIDKSTNLPTSWWWGFGDIEYISDQNPSHTYKEAGQFSVSLETENEYGTNKKTISNYITVTEPGITGQTGTFDYEGKTYKTITINGKDWMAENLAYLPKVNPPTVESDTEPYYYVYDYIGNDTTEAKASNNYINYGVLYNWPAAIAACPPGWHLPSDVEWMHLEMALGMPQKEVYLFGGRHGIGNGTADKMQEENSGWDYWISIYEHNVSRFSARPSGFFDKNLLGGFDRMGQFCSWWSSTEIVSKWAIDRGLGYGRVYRDETEKNLGFSVRCVKD